jgi:serine/threonine-protein kinase
MSLIAELKRRKVFKVGAAWLLIGWVAIQVAATIAPQLKLPEWMPTLVTVLVGLGFPVALVLAWFFDLTPEGIARDPADRVDPKTAANAALETSPSIPPTHSIASGPTRIDSIAVLPFQLRNSDADAEYLADGLGESLIYRLSRLSNLKVSPTSSVHRYRAGDTDPLHAGHALGVSAVLTGRLSQRGESLAISVELLDVRNDKLVWGERYDRRLADLLATQREIAAEIIDNIRPELSGSDRASLGKHYTSSNEAYQWYLKGRHHYASRTRSAIERAIECYRQAIALDPQFALAYVGIADAYISMPAFSYLPSNETYPFAIASARQALALDPGLGSAHTALAVSLASHDWNWAEAGHEFRRALELDPNVADTHFRYAISYLAPTGRLAEATASLEHALELEPLSLIMGTNLSLVYIYARRYDRALAQARKTHDLEPGFMTGRLALAFAYAANAMHDEAIALAESEPQDSPTYRWFLVLAAYVSGKAHRMDEARKLLDRYNEMVTAGYASSYYLATAYSALGDADAAIAALEKAMDERDFFVTRLAIDPFLDDVRGDPRFAACVRKIGLAR